MALQLIDVTSGAGDTAPAGGAKINANFTEVYADVDTLEASIAAVESDIADLEASIQSTTRTALVDPVAGDDALASAGGLPFATFVAAATAAAAASPTASNPVLIRLSVGVHTVGADVTISSAYIALSGSGMATSVLNFTGAFKLTFGASNLSATDIKIARSGSNTGAVFTVNTANIETFRENVRLSRVHVENLLGTAVATLRAECVNCRFNGFVGVDWAYSAICLACVFEGHDPTGVATTAAVNESQSCCPNVFGDMKRDRISSFTGCKFICKDIKGHCIDGLVERENGERVTLVSWFKNQGTPLSEMQTSYATRLTGCDLIGPEMAQDGDGGGYGIRGCFWSAGCTIYADRVFSWVFASEFVGWDIVTTSPAAVPMMDQVSGCEMQGLHFTTYDTSNWGTLTESTMNNILIQNDALPQVQGMQYLFRGSGDNKTFAADACPRGIFGWESKQSLALRIGRTNIAAAYNVALFAVPTDAFQPDILTAECWFRCGAPTGTHYLMSALNISTGWILAVDNNSGGRVLCYVEGVAVFTAVASVFDSAWHHIALVSTGGETWLYIDGVPVASAVATGAPSGTSHFIVGNSGALNTAWVGDIKWVRVSNTARYIADFSANLPVKFFPDANTIALYRDGTNRPLAWTDEMGKYPLAFYGGGSNPKNFPYWVFSEDAYSSPIFSYA